MEPTKRCVMVFDPGRTTGLAIAEPTGKGEDGRWAFDILACEDIEWDERFDIRPLLVKWQPTDIVIESFNLYPGAAAGQAKIRSDFPSIQVIGIILAYVNELDLPEPIFQSPSTRKRAQILAQHRDYTRGSPHKRDAYKHLRYYIVTNSKHWFKDLNDDEQQPAT